MKRKEFIQKSLMAASGVYLASNFISCSDDDDVIIQRIIKEKEKQFTKKGFEHGIASFDPTDSQVIIWTRYSVKNPSKVSISWQIASDKVFKNVIRSGEVETNAERDYTIAVEVQELDPGQKLYYRFMQLEDEAISDIGETITFPKDPQRLSLAVCCCSNYPAGYFNVYHAMAKSNAEVVIHLGDYIYEYGKGGYGTTKYTNSMNRHNHPEHEILSLKDYRDRYKLYRSDEDLKLVHQKKPFICVWDDHEVANDAYKSGAGNHQPEEGDYQNRKQAAIQAYSEYIPVRTKDKNKIYRSFTFGSLVNLIMLDTRIIGRDEQLHYDQFIEPGDSRDSIDIDQLKKALNDPSRGCLGSEQLSWLGGQLNSSASWQVIGNQVLMGKMMLPEKLLIKLLDLINLVKKDHSLKVKDIEDFANVLATDLLIKIIYEYTEEGEKRSKGEKLLELYEKYPDFCETAAGYKDHSFRLKLTKKDRELLDKDLDKDEKRKLTPNVREKITAFRDEQYPDLMKELRKEMEILNKIDEDLRAFIFDQKRIIQLTTLVDEGKPHLFAAIMFMSTDYSPGFDDDPDFGPYLGFFIAKQPYILDIIKPEHDKRFNERLVPYHLDSWDGYSAEREKVLNLFESKNVVVLSGDSHNAWCNKLVNKDGKEVCKEFGTSSVSSPGIGEYLDGIHIPGIKEIFKKCLELLVDSVEYVDVERRGYLKATFTHGGADIQYLFVDNILSKQYNVMNELIKTVTKK